MTRLHIPTALALATGLATACTEVPELDRAVPAWVDDADYPALIPLEEELAMPPAPAEAGKAITDELAARRDRLQERARRLNARPVIDGATRSRMAQGLAEG